jgi:protein-tyrosine phosphatase
MAALASDGYCDLHCHLLPGVDDGPKTLAESLEMGRALWDLGFRVVAPSPHARPEYAARAVAEARLQEVRQALADAGVPLELHANAENDLVGDRFLQDVATAEGRRLGAAGRYVLVEAPYTAPVPALRELIFQMKVKGVTPLLAHPERCVEFERKGRAEEAVAAGAALQLDLGALIGRYGRTARRLAEGILEAGLYAVAATDLHSPIDAREWVGKSLAALRSRAGDAQARAMLEERPRKILRGEPLD